MDFARPHQLEESVASKSQIRYLPLSKNYHNENEEEHSLDDKLIDAANHAAQDLLLGPVSDPDPRRIDAALYADRSTPLSEKIENHDLVVIFESFDNLNFVYATPGDIFCNRNGHFYHDDFLGKPFGCKIRSRNNRGYGYVYLLKPTPELWARSLQHRTQIVHELDASMVVFYLQLRPNMVVCESGTGSGAMSHAILRTIAPQGKLHTFEFNQHRADTARQEFDKHGLSHLVHVHHKDVCGKFNIDNNNNNNNGGFDLPGRSVHAVFLDLPEPWLAIPHAAYVLKSNGRIASYSPCIEQSQRAVAALTEAGFHTIKTLEFRIRENYVDEVEYDLPPKEKRPRMEPNPYVGGNRPPTSNEDNNTHSGGEDTGAEADNEKSELSETEADQLSLATAEEVLDAPPKDNNTNKQQDVIVKNEAAPSEASNPKSSAATGKDNSVASASAATSSNTNINTNKRANKKLLVARPFPMMRGHTAFLTFATAGNIPQPDPNKES